MVYADPATTQVAIEGLNGLSIGQRVLTVKRAADVGGGLGVRGSFGSVDCGCGSSPVQRRGPKALIE